MQPDDFIAAYEAALAAKDGEQLAALFHPQVHITFSTGATHRGQAAARAAFERNFTLIANEHYAMTDIHWVIRADTFAVFAFCFSWSGEIADKPASGAGVGTAMLVREGERWLLIAEHLGRSN